MRQEEEKRRLEEKQQAETLLQQIEELKLQEAEVALSPCFPSKYSNADLTSSHPAATRSHLEQSPLT